MAVWTRRKRDTSKEPDGLRPWVGTLGARLDALLDDGDRWKAKGLLSFAPAAVVAWFGVALVDLRILAAAVVLGAAGFWYARRRRGEEEFTDDDADLL